MRRLDIKKIAGAMLLLGMALMIPCYLFTAGNAALSLWPLYERNRIALVVIALVAGILLVLGMRAIDRHEDFFVRNERRVLAAAVVFYFIVQMVLGQCLRFAPMTDTEQCHTAAALLVDTGTFAAHERAVTYFQRCPHNLGFVYVLAAIFRVCNLLGIADRYTAMVTVSSALFALGLLAGARVAHRIGGGARGQAKFLMMCASCLPLLYCTTELYTDAFSLAFPVMTIYACLRLREAKTARGRVLWALAFTLVSFMGAQIKFTVVIAANACVIALIFERRGRAALCALAVRMATRFGTSSPKISAM